MQPRSSSDILATAKVRFKRKKPTVSAYRGHWQIMSFSPSSLGNINNSKSCSSAATIEYNDDHPFLGQPEFPPESFMFRFELPKLEDKLQQDSTISSSSMEYKDYISAVEFNEMLAYPVLRKFYPKYISV